MLIFKLLTRPLQVMLGVLLLIPCLGCSLNKGHDDLMTVSLDAYNAVVNNDYGDFKDIAGTTQLSRMDERYVRFYFNMISDEVSRYPIKDGVSLEVSEYSEGWVDVLKMRYDSGVFSVFNDDWKYYEVFYVFADERSFTLTFVKTRTDIFLLIPIYKKPMPIEDKIGGQPKR